MHPRLQSFLLRQLSKRRPYANKPWQRVLAGHRTKGDGFLLCSAAALIAVPISFSLATLLDSSSSTTTSFATFFMTALALAWFTVVGLAELSGGPLTVSELDKLSGMMNSSPSLTNFCAPWWPTDEILRRRDWFRVHAANWVLKCSPRPAPNTLIRVSKPSTPDWRTASSTALASLQAQHRHWQGKPAPLAGLSTELSRQVTVASRPRARKPWNHPGMRILGRCLDKHDFLVVSVAVLLMTGVMTYATAWALSLDVVQSGPMVILFFSWLGGIGCVAVWEPWAYFLPPLPRVLASLGFQLHAHPVLAWAWANGCRDVDHISHADVLCLFRLAAAIEQERKEQADQQARQQATLNLPAVRARQAQAEAEALEASLTAPTASATARTRI